MKTGTYVNKLGKTAKSAYPDQKLDVETVHLYIDVLFKYIDVFK